MKANLPILFSDITENICTPLSLIIEHLEQINKEIKISNDIKKKISEIQSNARQLLRLINQLSDPPKIASYSTVQKLPLPDVQLIIQKPNDPFLEQLYQVIEKHLDQSCLDVGKLAENMNVSRRTLNRKLTMLVQLSAHEVIKQYRLKKAVMLLQSGYNVSETAYRVGFETPSYFSSAFKNFYSICPSAFVRQKMSETYPI